MVTILRPKMTSLLGGQLFQVGGQGPAPTKDFFQLVITKDEVMWRSWKISLRVECRGAPPTELKTSHHDFLHQKMLQEQVGAIFGQRTLEYAISLCQGNYNYLERLSEDLLLKILSNLQLKDITQLAQTSHRFKELCNSERFWEQTVRTRCPEFTDDMEGVANAMGWRKIYFTLFHTSGTKEQQGSNITF